MLTKFQLKKKKREYDREYNRKHKVERQEYRKQWNAERNKVKRADWLAFFASHRELKCIQCGYDKFWGAIDFHHRDPMIKEFEISNRTVRWVCSAENQAKVLKEIDKCDLLCANCHREVHSST